MTQVCMEYSVKAGVRKRTAREFLMPWLPMPLSRKPSAIEHSLLRGRSHDPDSENGPIPTGLLLSEPDNSSSCNNIRHQVYLT